MDPNTNLQKQAELLIEIAKFNPCAEKRRLQRELKELRVALLQWLRNGGFEPTWDHYPAAMKYFGVVMAPNVNGALRASYKVAVEAGCARR